MTDDEKISLLNKLFEKKGFTPNDSQREAILHTGSPLFLTAGPGSGKTRVLLWKTVNLIVCHEIQPNEIFLATFTEKAALQLKEGLQGLLSLASEITHKPYDIAEMYVGTLHSLCQKLLTDRRFMVNQARSRKPILLDELDQHFFVRDHWQELIEAGEFDENKLKGEHCFSEKNGKCKFSGETCCGCAINRWYGERQKRKSKTTAVNNSIAFFNRMTEEDFSDSELKLKNSSDIEKSMLKMTKKYRELLQESTIKRVDFAILQQMAFQHITQTKDAGSVFQYVIVDEYQDTNTIQQKIYLQLASGNKNICVVGDDDQALYRFRGATVENLVNFEDICKKAIGVKPKRIDLNINYRSRREIVEAYSSFIEKCNWQNPDNKKQYYRIHDKVIIANSEDYNNAIICESGKKNEVVTNIVKTIKELKETGKITDYNQCAFLFPYMSKTYVEPFKEAFEEANIPVYAPRANSILKTKEFQVVFGLFAKIFKFHIPSKDGETEFQKWLQEAIRDAELVMEQDKNLEDFITEKWTEIEIMKKNYSRLSDFCEKNNLHFDSFVNEQIIQRLLIVPALDEVVEKSLKSGSLHKFIDEKAKNGKPLSIGYVLSRVTALDWTLLDLFYHLNTFKWFVDKYDDVERGGEDSALYNFGLLTQYISKYMEKTSPIITGRNFQQNALNHSFFSSYLYTIFQLGESEYEDADDPFPKGCVPFLTIHQSKGLEFPVVVLGSTKHSEHDRPLDTLVRKMLTEKNALPSLCEPLDRMDAYDTIRMFYVGLSRAKNLMIITDYTDNKRTPTFEPFEPLLYDNDKNPNYPNSEDFDFDKLPSSDESSDKMVHVYTYTGDYLPYKNCPRNYVMFHKYNFVPSRSQTMFFGSLVHQTIEDLQNFINGVNAL